MLIRNRRPWELPEQDATPESVFLNRRAFLGATAGLIAGAALPRMAFGGVSSSDLYPVPRNEAFTLERPITDEAVATTYNNFYEFGSHKKIARAAQKLVVDPWTVTIDGMVEKEIKIDAHDLIRQMPLEERLYRHRCVEAWSMAVPWSGFPLKALLDFARPLGSAKYLKMETFVDSDVASGQRAFWYPWPYVEGLRMDEAQNELAFIATGLYGKPIPKQNGAPLRLVVPWKYGFKSVKSVVRFHFTDEMPVSFWMEVQGSEYGFWANVNPGVPHRRWSQAEERLIGTDERRPTLIYNGYGEQVAHLYEGMPQKKLFF
ncbi:MAG TPA: protein-methionine-sulfoxide reductase catalytic subunit MsrP [Alphaproteobacteria bacterium]|nr:protein-methionine-sulfoxide reductase catalytic subunit MsrP [Alphaproteobacteria bacterium]